MKFPITLAFSLLALFGNISRAERPNIVVFLSDDHTWRDSSLYGSTEIQTPHMERVASAGMTFDRAYVNSPSCAPARAALLTGLYPARNGAEANHSRPRADIKKLPAYFQQLGYEVVSFGKVGHYRQTPEYGFDLARHFGYHEDVAVPNAIKWLRERDSDKPLCLFVGTNWPHVPWPTDSDEFAADELQVPPTHVDNPTTREWRSRYLAAVRTMDNELGQVYDAAREKFGDNFIFLHTSDHGAQWPFGKWNLYEDGIRCSLIVTWPGNIKPATRSSAMVSWMDILPTLVEMAGGEAPQTIDGRSFLPVLRGETKSHRDAIFTTHSGDGNNNVFPIRSVRSADGWKYIRNLHPKFLFTSHVTGHPSDSGYWRSWLQSAVTDSKARDRVLAYQRRPAEELYQLKDDAWEVTNLIDDPAHAARVNELSERLDAWMAQTKDPQQVFGVPKKIAAKEKPNIITVFIDDMGWSDLSCFGGDVVQTENIDRLASEGIKFQQFYVNSPICSPSRVALTTGQYPQRWRITSFLNNRKNNNERGMAQWLDPDAPVLARQLSRSGYATGHFGKWHMGGQRDVNNAPPIHQYGFDQSLTNFEGMGAKLLPLTMTPDSPEPGRIWEGAVNLGEPVTWMQRSEITAGFVQASLEFIDQALASKQPFYINVWPDDVHSPFFPPLERWGETKRDLYYGVLKTMDEQLGVLFDRIRNDQRLRNNTLIVFCSDNGHEPGAGQSDPLRGAKTWLYEGGIRSPLIVWGLGLLAEDAPGMTNDSSVFSAIDINRSLYTITGTPLPNSHQLDGEDVSATMLGQSKVGREKPIFFRRPPDRPGDDPKWGMGDNPDLAVRDGEWKFLINYDGSNPQLYDIVADPAESKNLAEQFPKITERLRQAVFAWNASVPADAGNPKFEKTAANDGTQLPPNQFVNPIGEGADPWVVRDPNANRYSCFVSSPDASELWHVFHAKRDREPGWRRAVFVQPMEIGQRGFPRFSQPVQPGLPLNRPAGETQPARGKLPFIASLDAKDTQLAFWNPYGHHQFIAFEEDGLNLGRVPDAPINDYRSGEKVMLDVEVPDDLSIAVSIDFLDDAQARDAGILFRTTGPSVGYDAQRGYFVGLIPKTEVVIFGIMDGNNWRELARARTTIDVTKPQLLRVEIKGDDFTAFHNEKKILTTRDGTYSSGEVGLRVVNTHARFNAVHIE